MGLHNSRKLGYPLLFSYENMEYGSGTQMRYVYLLVEVITGDIEQIGPSKLLEKIEMVIKSHPLVNYIPNYPI